MIPKSGGQCGVLIDFPRNSMVNRRPTAPKSGGSQSVRTTRSSRDEMGSDPFFPQDLSHFRWLAAMGSAGQLVETRLHARFQADGNCRGSGHVGPS